MMLLLLLLTKLQVIAVEAAAWIICRGIVEERPIAVHIVFVVVHNVVAAAGVQW